MWNLKYLALMWTLQVKIELNMKEINEQLKHL